MNRDSLKAEILAGRQTKDWKTFIKCGYKFAQPEENKMKRMKRALIVGNAIDAFEDVPNQEKGFRFLQNEWH